MGCLDWIELRKNFNSYQIGYWELEKEKNEAESRLERLVERNGKRFTIRRGKTISIINHLKEIIDTIYPNETSSDKLFRLEQELNNFDYTRDIYDPSIEEVD